MKSDYFSALKNIIDYTYEDLLELDDITLYRFASLMNVDIDSLEGEEYENFIEKCLFLCRNLQKILEKSEKLFNKGMILFE